MLANNSLLISIVSFYAGQLPAGSLLLFSFCYCHFIFFVIPPIKKEKIDLKKCHKNVQ